MIHKTKKYIESYISLSLQIKGKDINNHIISYKNDSELKIKLLNIVFVLLLIFSNSVLAQTDATIQRYGIENGLSQGTINCLFQDSKGFIWIGTQDGLNKFDGYKFRSFRHQPLSDSSISSNYIQSICEDKDGRLWIATQYGLSVYNSQTGNFFTYLNNPQKNNTISDNNAHAVLYDKNGYIWLKTERRLDKIDIRTKEILHFDFDFDEFNYASEYNYFHIIRDSRAKIWLATKDGLNLFDRNSEMFFRFIHDKRDEKSLSHNEVRRIYEDRQNNLWVGTQNGLNRFNRGAKNFDTYFINKKFANNTILEIFEDSFGVLWIGTESGLYQFDRNTETFNEINFNSVYTNDLRTAKITAIIEDKSKILWIATWNGIYKIDRKPKKFQLLQFTKNIASSLPENQIYSILEDENKNIWMGTKHAGLLIIDQKNNKRTVYSTQNNSNYIVSNNITKIYQSKNKDILIGTNFGVYIYNKESKQFDNFCKVYDVKQPESFKNNRIYDIVDEKNGEFWFATQNGLIHFNKKEFKTYLPIENDTNSLCSKVIYCLLEDSYSNIWVGTINGLNKYDRKKDKFIRYDKKPNQKRGLSNRTILTIFETNDGAIWVGTETGLNKYDVPNDKFIFFTQHDGFISDYIYGIQEDKSGNLWLSTNHGISRFNLLDKSITNYDLDDGLQGYEFNLGATFKNKKGEIFFGGVNGVNYFLPDSMVINKYVPNTIITKIEKRSANKRQEILLSENQEITLESYENNLSIEFALLEYTQPEKNQFKYMMAGLENDWNETGKQRTANYIQLPVGKYIFKVKGSNHDGVWNNQATEIKINVLPPFWKTTYAYIFYCLLLVTAIYSFIIYKTRTIRKENLILLQKQKDALEIARQKEELSIKNLNITDSIHYAKHIIDAMLPSDKQFKRILPESFVLYLPKDIVSGDFYWIAEKNNKVFVAAVDCTGHGVPGAFMSIIGYDLLRNIINEQGIEKPDEILNRLNIEVANTFRNEPDETTVKDGMDIAFCVIDRDNKKIEYAGAINPLYIIRNNNIIEIEANRFSVGFFDDIEHRYFTGKSVDLEENDIIYIFSDGYTDQFGGPAQKKFKFRRFRHQLLSIQNLSMDKQKEYLENTIARWRGNLEQVDDILIIGIKPISVQT